MRRTHFFSNWYSGTNTSLTETAVNEKKKKRKKEKTKKNKKQGETLKNRGNRGKLRESWKT